MEHSIDVVNADGSGHRVLRRNAFDPAWSPDGKKIAFVNGRLELWLMNANGTGAHRLLDTGFGVGDPAWSPDGKQIAFVRGLLEGEIYIVNADGTDRYVLPSDPRLGLASPEWSPDGTKLAFTGHIPNAFVQAIYVSSADGRELTQITHGTRDFDPSWR